MQRIVHLSDLHLLASPERQAGTFASMIAAVETVAEERRADGGAGVDLVAITGDLFNSASLEVEHAIAAARDLLAEIARATRGARVIIVPGNHDVRRAGLLGPHTTTLLGALARALGDDGRVVVHGRDTPFLTERLAPEVHGLPAEIVLVDSSFLPEGRISAGGLLRQEDLLHVACEIADQPEDRVVIVLLHHHLVPTPLTDVGKIDLPIPWRSLRGLVHKALSGVVANADREELMMTALGAGTALSTLHTLGRPIVALHGHKHYPAVRLLRGVFDGHGDVLLASAGSAGLAEPWWPTDHDEAAPLWPSFNVVDLDGEGLHIGTILYPPRPEPGKVVRRPMVEVRRDGAGWHLVRRFGDRTPTGSGPRLGVNVAAFEILGASPSAPHWSARVTRTLTPPAVGEAPDAYDEPVEGAPHASLRDVDDARGLHAELPRGATIHLRVDGTSRYHLVNGLVGTIPQAELDYGRDTSPYEWIGLFNRYACDHARVVLRGLPEGVGRPFGSATDLASGLQSPMPLQREGDAHVLAFPACPPRTLLRIYWRLPRGG